MNCLVNPTVSVIIPCFNAEQFLEPGLRSLISQGYKELEIIVVDDFSTDNSSQVVRKIATLDPRICLLENKSKGANTARETGVAHSTGDYIAFMDADDVWTEDAFEILVEQALKTKVDLVCCNMLAMYGESSVKLFPYRNLNKVVDCEKDWLLSLDVPPSACAKLFKAELLKSVPFDNVPFAQDWNVSYKGMVLAKTVFFIDNPLYIYIRREGSTCSIKNKVLLKDILSAERSIIEIESRHTNFGAKSFRDLFVSVLKIRFYLDLAIRSCWLDSSSDRKLLLDYFRSKISARLLVRNLFVTPSIYECRKIIILFGFLYLSPMRGLLKKFYQGRLRA